MKVGIAVLGLTAVTTAIRKRVEGTQDRVAEAVNDVAREVLSESQRVVPVDTGNLRSSARMTAAKRDAPTARITYGGTAAEYALAVHELHRSRSKYLEAPARAAAGRLKDKVTIAVRKGA
jgi:hypothetical protein